MLKVFLYVITHFYECQYQVIFCIFVCFIFFILNYSGLDSYRNYKIIRFNHCLFLENLTSFYLK